MSDPVLLSRFIARDRAHLLTEYIIPTFCATRPPRQEAERWVSKPAHGGKGKGKGIKFLDRPELLPGSVLQPAVEQRLFRLHDGREIKLVGLLPMWRDKTYGPGIFRGGEGEVINLSDGGVLIGASL